MYGRSRRELRSMEETLDFMERAEPLKGVYFEEGRS